MNIDHKIIEEVKTLAHKWQTKIQVSRKTKEKDFHEMMLKMLQNPMNKVFLIELLDQSFRASDTTRVANQLEYIFDKYKDINFFSDFEQILIWIFRHIGIYVSSISIPMFIDYLRNDISTIVIKGEESILSKHLRDRKKEGTRVNINVIGEIVLSHEEAKQRVKKYIQLLKNPDIDYLSIKISNLFSQIVPHAHQYNIDKISFELEKIYREALVDNKFVNLDMEEYKDIELTIDTFKNVLNKDEFKNLYAGIVIQSYLPDAMIFIKDLSAWAKQRVVAGGAPIKIRIVKGANQEMELTESSLRNWKNVTFMSKAESDANFKIAMNFLIDPGVAPFVHVGIASHNLFDQALARLLTKQRNLKKYVSAEMLEGMSEAAYNVLKEDNLDVILYAPTATKETFTNAIAYLVRRFDENTAEQNFLRHSFGLEVDSDAWISLVKSYEKSIGLMPTLYQKAYRVQDRTKEIDTLHVDTNSYTFENEADTDFALNKNKIWADSIVEKWQNIGDSGGFKAYPVVVGEILKRDEYIQVIDKSQYHEKKLAGSYVVANKSDLELAITTAKQDPDGWRKLSLKQRQEVLMRVAQEIRKARGDLIGIAAAEVGKVFSETDVEVSEAIDFVNFYPISVQKIINLDGVKVTPKGVGLVISPWNFPIAIPVGGIAASLAAGNTVLLKASADSILCGYRLCQCFWDAGVSKNTLQFIPASGSLVSEVVVKSKDVDFVIFTGSEKTAYDIIKASPDTHLSAETGGKDATIVTALADREQAIKNVVISAFNNSGQKCSATSILVLEKEVYEDKVFKQTLKEAVESLEVGSAWDFKNKIATLSGLANEKLTKAISYLEDNEEWLVKPSYLDNNPYMLKPSVRWGTKQNDFCHMNELFGPVLSVMCADDLEHAIEIVNSTGYGLTSGIETLDKREQDYFKLKLLAGNLYINRGTTGAIVIRQPFGGMRKSAIGSGKKAGGFNYVSQFMNISDDATIPTAMSHFSYWHEKEFLKEHDYANIRGESNIIRYLHVESVLLRIEEDDNMDEILTSIKIIKMVGASLHVSLAKEYKKDKLILLECDSVSRDDEKELIAKIYTVQRVRFLNPNNVTKKIYESIADKAIYIASDKFVWHARLELMHYFIEQSISNSYHRYGNLGIKALTLDKS